MYSFAAANGERVNVDAEFAVLRRLKKRISKKVSAREANATSQRLFSFFLMTLVALFLFWHFRPRKGQIGSFFLGTVSGMQAAET